MPMAPVASGAGDTMATSSRARNTRRACAPVLIYAAPHGRPVQELRDVQLLGAVGRRRGRS
eukprot:3083981-Pyramimonas_sp.AAC.1